MNQPSCKLVFLKTIERPILKVRVPNNENVVKVSAIKKCLFGKSDPADTKKLLEEQKEIDRKRIMERFGIDITQIDNLENENNRNIPNLNKTKKKNVGNRKRKSPSSENKDQGKITDFFKSKKSCRVGKDKEDTEN